MGAAFGGWTGGTAGGGEGTWDGAYFPIGGQGPGFSYACRRPAGVVRSRSGIILLGGFRCCCCFKPGCARGRVDGARRWRRPSGFYLIFGHHSRVSSV